MAKIQSAPKTRMTISEFYYFCLFIVNYLSASNFSVLKFKTAFNYFKDKFDGYDNSINKISKMDYDKKAVNMKKKLNASRTGLFNMVSGLSASSVADIKTAATIVLDLINKKYRNMSKLKYKDLQLTTASLLNDLESEEYKTYIEKMELTTIVTALRTLYNECIQLESKLISADGVNKRLRKTVNTRRELNIGSDRLVDQLNALAQVEGDTEYLELFTWWNALIDDYRTKISARSGAGTGGKTQTDESSQSDPNKGADNNSGGGDDDRPVIE